MNKNTINAIKNNVYVKGQVIVYGDIDKLDLSKIDYDYISYTGDNLYIDGDLIIYGELLQNDIVAFSDFDDSIKKKCIIHHGNFKNNIGFIVNNNIFSAGEVSSIKSKI